MPGSFILYDSSSSGRACHPFTNEKEPWAGSRALAVPLGGFVSTCHLARVSGDSCMASPPCLRASGCRALAPAPLSLLEWKARRRGGCRC